VMSRVRPQLNAVTRNVSGFDEDRKAMIAFALGLAKQYMDSDGQLGLPVTWFAMLDEDVREQVLSLV
jgi:hypothetical protein